MTDDRESPRPVDFAKRATSAGLYLDMPSSEGGFMSGIAGTISKIGGMVSDVVAGPDQPGFLAPGLPGGLMWPEDGGLGPGLPGGLMPLDMPAYEPGLLGPGGLVDPGYDVMPAIGGLLDPFAAMAAFGHFTD